MIVFDKLLFGGVRFVLEKIGAAADAEREDADALRARLLESQMLLEQGRITPAELVEIERDVLGRLRELREQGEDEGPVRLGGDVGVEVELHGPDEAFAASPGAPTRAPPARRRRSSGNRRRTRR